MSLNLKKSIINSPKSFFFISNNVNLISFKKRVYFFTNKYLKLNFPFYVLRFISVNNLYLLEKKFLGFEIFNSFFIKIKKSNPKFLVRKINILYRLWKFSIKSLGHKIGKKKGGFNAICFGFFSFLPYRYKTIYGIKLQNFLNIKILLKRKKKKKVKKKLLLNIISNFQS